ncbi:hypothetical protein K502DRAFT_347524 [Neoconidiobolus thromboides FSU 785]|nr:hypothetical protein K502DRAFT_347524 [Neoconidiobolus thromboides FSU 785]
MALKSKTNFNSGFNSGPANIKSSHSQHPNQKERIRQPNGPAIKLKGKPVNQKHRSLPSPVPQIKVNSIDNKNNPLVNKGFKLEQRRNSLSTPSATQSNLLVSTNRHRNKANNPNQKDNKNQNNSKVHRRKTAPSSKAPELVPGSIQIQKRVTKESSSNLLLDALVLGKPRTNLTSSLSPVVDLNLDYHSDSQAYPKTDKAKADFEDSNSNVSPSKFEQDLDMASHLLMNLMIPTPNMAISKPKPIQNVPYAGPTFRRAPDPKALPFPIFTNRLTP